MLDFLESKTRIIFYTGLAETKKPDDTKYRGKETLWGIYVGVITFVPAAHTTLPSSIILLATYSRECYGHMH